MLHFNIHYIYFLCSKFLVNNVIPIKKKIDDMFRSYSALIVKYMFFCIILLFQPEKQMKDKCYE